MLFNKLFKKDKKPFLPQIIKVCGMRDAQNISNVVYAGANVIGLTFCPNSPRYVHQLSTNAGLIPDVGSLDYNKKTNLRNIFKEKQVKLCGIFADDMPQTIVARVVNFNLDIVQLNGTESPIMIANLRSSLDLDIHPGIKIIKTISVATPKDLEQCKTYEGFADYFLFKAKTEQKEDNDQPFDWNLLKAYKGNTPFLLSGGISEYSVQAIWSIEHPLCVGIDVNSQFEKAPAQKDAAKLERFITQLYSPV